MKTKGQKGAAPEQSPKNNTTDNETENKKNGRDENLKQSIPGKNKGEERNKQHKRLKSDVSNSPDKLNKQEYIPISGEKSIHRRKTIQNP